MNRAASADLRSRERPGGIGNLVREADPRLLDIAVALALTAVGLVIVFGRTAEGDYRGEDLVGIVLACAQTLPLAVRRTAPLGVVMSISAALVFNAVLGYEVVQTGTIASLIAIYGAATLADGRRSLVALTVTGIAIAGFYAFDRGDWGAVDAAAVSATWAMAWLFGTFVRIRGEQAEAAGARVVSLELEHEARAREAVADERARMARELHDIVGHALNLIVIQAAGAQRVFEARPEVPRQALASIESTGREALVDMERMLGVLRAADAGNRASLPQLGLGQLDGLAAHVSEAGIPVHVVIDGERTEVPASVDVSAYRIVQESLTNCLKHSHATQVTVTVRYRPESVTVEIIDNGQGVAPHPEAGGGRGQPGLRERVALFGGEISMGPRAGENGYYVRALLPFKGTSL